MLMAVPRYTTLITPVTIETAYVSPARLLVFASFAVFN